MSGKALDNVFKLHDIVNVKEPRFGAKGDGVTSDTVAFAAAKAAGAPIFVPQGSYLADFTIGSDEMWIFERATIKGQVDCTDAQRSVTRGDLIILPQSGDAWGMKWRKTRYCHFGSIRIGNTLTLNTHPGKGLLVEGGASAGTYYNTVDKAVIVGMSDYGFYAQTDATESLFRIGSNRFGSLQIQYCPNGFFQEGASNQIFNDLGIEQCEGTILAMKAGAGGALSNGNRILGWYSENPSLGTWIDWDSTCVGNEVSLCNTADGSVPPAGFLNGAGNIWHARGDLIMAASALATYGQLKVYGAAADTNPRTQISGTQMTQGPGSGATDCTVGRQGVALWGTDNATSLRAGDGTWNGSRLRMGSYHLWVDATGDLRIKSSAPTSDTDGTVVGNQT